MDAFAVSICKGLSLGSDYRLSHSVKAGIWFGGFQALMPLLGYLLGSAFSGYVEKYSAYISFALLAFIGVKMAVEGIREGENEEGQSGNTDVRTMFLLAVATSIDAFAVGVTFSLDRVPIIPGVSIIGVTTFIFSSLGVKIGNVFGAKHRKIATIAGGVVLTGLGIRFLIEGILS